MARNKKMTAFIQLKAVIVRFTSWSRQPYLVRLSVQLPFVSMKPY